MLTACAKISIPADALYLDIDYQDKNRPFTVNKEAFPDLAGWLRRCIRRSFHVVAITDLHIAYLPGQDYAPFDSGIAGDHFLKNRRWLAVRGPGLARTQRLSRTSRDSKRGRGGELSTRQFTKMGIDGFWNDMNEPSVFNSLKTMPDSVVHRIDEPGFCDSHGDASRDSQRLRNGKLARHV